MGHGKRDRQRKTRENQGTIIVLSESPVKRVARIDGKTYESARMILVFDTFSIVNFVRPPLPAIRPIALARCSPFRGFTEREQNLFFIFFIQTLLCHDNDNINKA